MSRIFTHFVIRLSIDCRNSDSVYYIDSCSCNCNTAQTGKGSRHFCSIKLIPEATSMKMSRDVIQILVLVHSLHTVTFTGRKSISIQLQNSGKLRRKRFISRRSVRLEIFSTIFFWIQCVPIEIEHEMFTKKHRHNASFRVWRPRERETRRRRQVWKD